MTSLDETVTVLVEYSEFRGDHAADVAMLIDVDATLPIGKVVTDIKKIYGQGNTTVDRIVVLRREELIVAKP